MVVGRLRRDDSRAAISALLRPSASRPRISISRAVRPRFAARGRAGAARKPRAPRARSARRSAAAAGRAPSRSKVASACASAGSSPSASARACSYGQPSRSQAAAAARQSPAICRANGSAHPGGGARLARPPAPVASSPTTQGCASQRPGRRPRATSASARSPVAGEPGRLGPRRRDRRQALQVAGLHRQSQRLVQRRRRAGSPRRARSRPSATSAATRLVIGDGRGAPSDLGGGLGRRLQRPW